jgi:hypothetical protein
MGLSGDKIIQSLIRLLKATLQPRIKIKKWLSISSHPISPLVNKSAMIALGSWPTPAAPMAGDSVKPIEGSMRKCSGSTETGLHKPGVDYVCYLHRGRTSSVSGVGM